MGIQIARKIRDEYGVDLFKLFKNSDEFKEWIRSNGIRSYERRLVVLPGTKHTVKKPKIKWQKENLSKLLEFALNAIEDNVKTDFIEKTF